MVYLNGAELFRVRMPDGIIRYTNEESVAIGNATFVRTNVPASALRSGDNVLAAEVHQRGATSTDVLFGLTLTADYPNPKMNGIRDGNNLALSWNAFGSQLESSASPQGPWTSVFTTNSSANVGLTNVAQFFRLRK